MKNVIIALAFSTAALSFAADAASDPLDAVGDRCAPGDVLFYGKTQNHKKEVLVCQWNTNIFYQFGKVGQNPELNLKLDVSQVNNLVDDSQTLSTESLFIPNGDVTYKVGRLTDLITNSDIDSVEVIKKGYAHGVEIILDSNTVVNGIRSNFVKQGN